jgi:serine/threonine-protein kinase
MEYIEGLPIDVYCDSHKLDISERLALFCQVCDAVGFAHRKLVVHRDLKPGNVLVTAEGKAKLLDFGIAKLLDVESAQLTRFGAQPMTPRYTSPEVLQGQPVSTASDVYSLGILLYELLAGVSPYGDASGATTVAMLRAALEMPVTAPSLIARRQAAAGDDLAAIRIARNRGTTCERLGKRLRGDLDTIVLTALRKEPEQRYESAALFAADIRRSETDLPIAARAPTLAYTARKFVARHTATVTAAAVAVCALVVTAAVATYYGITTQQQSRVIVAERDRAEQTQEFLLSIFEGANPNEARGTTITAKELLDRGAARIDEELSGQPHTQAILKATIGNIYVILGLYEEARPQLEGAAALFSGASTEPSPEYVEVLEQLSELTEIEGDYAAALKIAQQSLEISERAADQAGIARGSTRVGRVLHLMGKLDEAEPYYQNGLDIYIDLYGEEHDAVAQSLAHLGGFMSHTGRLDQAEALHQRSLEIRRTLHGNDHLTTIESMINLGAVRQNRGKNEAAIEMLDEALALNVRLLGPLHRDNAFIYNHRAHAEKALGNYTAAESDFRRSLDIVREQIGPAHPNYGIVLGNICKVLVLEEDFAGAEPCFREAHAVLAAALPEHWIPYDIEMRLGTTLATLGRYPEAESSLRSSVDGLTERRGRANDVTQDALRSLIEVLDQQGKSTDAEDYREMLDRPAMPPGTADRSS